MGVPRVDWFNDQLYDLLQNKLAHFGMITLFSHMCSRLHGSNLWMWLSSLIKHIHFHEGIISLTSGGWVVHKTSWTPPHFYWTVCTGSGKWTVVHFCIFSSLSLFSITMYREDINVQWQIQNRYKHIYSIYNRDMDVRQPREQKIYLYFV